MSVTLVLEGDLVGTLNLAIIQSHQFSEEDLNTAREIAKPLAVSIRQSLHHENMLHHADRLESRVEQRVTELAKAETRFQQVVEMMSNALIMTNSQGLLQLASTQAETLYGTRG